MKLGVQVNAVRQVCHRGQPCYLSATLKVSYKLFRLEQLVSPLEEQPLVSLQRQLLFEGNEICSNQGDLSAEDEIACAKARVHTPAGKKKRRQSSKSLLQVGLGEGRATRQVAKCIYCDRARPNDYPHVYTEMWFLNVKYLIFTPRQLEKIIIILKSSILLVKQMVPHKSIRMDLVTLQDLLFLPKRLMWKNITRLFLKFGSGSEMSHIIMLQLFFLLPLCMFTSDRHILPPT